MPRVVVFGSSNTDMTVRLPRLPAPGQTILGHSFLTTPGGKGANQAVAARRAGAEVVFVTAVGDDDLGRQALDLYSREGIDVSHARVVEGMSSGVALIFVDDGGENMIGVASGANLGLAPEDVDRLPDSLFRAGDVLLVSLEIPLETAIRALRRGYEAEMFTILNPAPAPAIPESEVRELFSAAIYITPNRLEAMAMAGIKPDADAEPDWGECGLRLIRMGTSVAIITLGSHGCQIVADKPWPIVPAPRVEAVDTVGAGDAFNGALATALAEGRSLGEAAVWANAAAALAVTRPGAQSALPTREAIDRTQVGWAPPADSGLRSVAGAHPTTGHGDRLDRQPNNE
jgi:ribokinase